MAQSPRAFRKHALSVDEQLMLLRERGLAIQNEYEAKQTLRHVGYYRLSGYMLSFQRGGRGEDRHQFLNGTTFEQISNLYSFDRKLRVLFLDALDRIEIALKSALSNAIAYDHGPHWLLDGKHFSYECNHAELLGNLKQHIGHSEPQKQTVFITHYYANYDEPDFPPCWMVFETLPFGTVSNLIRKLRGSNLKELSRQLNMPDRVIHSWCLSLSYLRNLCAHHSRIWNRTFTIKPMIARQHALDLTPNDRLYAQAVSVLVTLGVCSGPSNWKEKFKTLVAEHPEMTPTRLSFPDDWATRPIWR